jgi:hypothetical protein
LPPHDRIQPKLSDIGTHIKPLLQEIARVSSWKIDQFAEYDEAQPFVKPPRIGIERIDPCSDAPSAYRNLLGVRQQVGRIALSAHMLRDP